MLKFGLSIEEPLPNVEHNRLFEQFEDMYIFNSKKDRNSALYFVNDKGLEAEPLDLYWLPFVIQSSLVTDYGFHSPSYTYLYEWLITAFIFDNNANSSDCRAMLIELEEWLILKYEQNDRWIYLAPSQHQEFIVGISRAYQCPITFLK